MKKITLLLLTAFCWQINAQIFIEESLDNGTPAAWTSSNYFTNYNASYTCEGTQSIYNNMFYSPSYNGTITSNNYVGVSNNTDATVSFEWLSKPYESNAVDYIIFVEYSTDDGSSWNAITNFAVTESNLCTIYSETISAANLPSGSDFKFQIRGEWQSGDSYFYLDNIFISQAIACPAPSDLTATSITSTQAQLGWTENGSAMVYNVEVVAEGTTATGTATDPGVPYSFTKTGLVSATDYEYYVQADCGAGDTSLWVGPVAFTTEPDPIVPDYTNNFISYPGENWSEGTGETTPSGTSSGWTSDGFGNVGINGSARINIYGTGDDEWLITPTFDLSSGGYEINLDVALTDYDNTDADVIGDDDAVYLMQSPDNGVSWTQIHKWDFENSPSNSGDNKTFDISELTSATTKFALYMFEGSSPNGDVNFYVDNFAVRTPPSCFSPQSNSLSVANVSSSSVDILWAQGGTETDYQYVVQDAGTGQPTGVGMTVTGATTVTDTTLTAAKDYEIYVRSNCGTNGFSAWVGPLQFTTLCADVTEFSENFDSVTTPQLPVCWSELISSGVSSSASVETSTYADASVPNGVRLYNSFSTTGDVILVSPSVSNLAANTHRLKLKAKNTSSLQDIQIGTLSDPSDSSTFTLLETVDINTTFTEYVIDFSSYSGTDTYIGFRRLMSSTYTSVYLDDIVWEEIPSTPPSCASNFTGTLDTSCGNNDFSISWDPATNSDGYYISVGTTPGGTDIEASTDLGNVTTYDFTSVTVATTYYYTVVPYNASGSASECAEQNLTTVGTGCYCISTPSSNDGDGIAYVTFGDSEFTSAGDITYEDFTATAVSIGQSSSAKLDITFATGYTYDTHVWVDFNDDYNFSSDELMFSGESTSADPVTLDASFLVPSDAPLGDHRVRIGTADSGQETPNPCYDSTFGVTIDMTITVTDPPSCVQPSALTVADVTDNSVILSWTAGDTEIDYQYVVQFAGIGEPTGAGIAVIGATTVTDNTLTALTDYEVYVRSNCGTNGFSAWVGPETFTTDSDPIVPNYTNDFTDFPGEFWSEGAGALADGPSGTTALWGTGNFAHGTDAPAAYINIYDTNRDEWLISPTFDLSSVNYYLNIDAAATEYRSSFSSADPVDAIWGDDDFVTLMVSEDGGLTWTEIYRWDANNSPGVAGAAMPEVDLSAYSGLTKFAFYAESYIDNEDIDFFIDNFSITTTSLGLEDVNTSSNFTYFPNPVNNVLSIKAQASIDSITVYNMLGQTVVKSTPNTTTTAVDMSKLQTGAYFVQVAINNSIETVRVLKN